LERLEIIGVVLIVFGILGLIGTGYSYTLGTASEIRTVLDDSSAILDRHESSIRSTGEAVQGISQPLQLVGKSMRDAGTLINLLPFVSAGDPLVEAGGIMHTIGAEMNVAGSDLIDTSDDMKSLAENLSMLSDDIIIIMNMALMGLGLMSVMIILVGFGFMEIASDRRERHQMRRDIEELKRR